MFKNLNPAEDTITTQITVTNGFHDGGVGTLAGSNYTTSSLSSTQKQYYYNVQYNSKDHFSVSYGHIGGSGSAEETTTVEGTKAASDVYIKPSVHTGMTLEHMLFHEG